MQFFVIITLLSQSGGMADSLCSERSAQKACGFESHLWHQKARTRMTQARLAPRRGRRDRQQTRTGDRVTSLAPIFPPSTYILKLLSFIYA